MIEVVKVNFIIPPSTWLRALVPAQLKNMLLCISVEKELGLCFIAELLLLDFLTVFSLFLHSLASLKIIDH